MTDEAAGPADPAGAWAPAVEVLPDGVDVDVDAFSSTHLPGPFELMEGDEVTDADIPVEEVLNSAATRGMNLGLSPAEIRLRWQVLVNRLRGYRRDRVLVDRQAFWLPILELSVPPHGKATLQYEQQAGKTKGAALKILGLGFGSSESISISRTVELTAKSIGKAFEWKMQATVTRYVDGREGADLLRVDLASADGGVNFRARDLPPERSFTATSAATDDWRLVNRMDLSRSADVGHAKWSYRSTRRGSWTAGIQLAPLRALGIDLLKLESEQSDRFEVSFELPYGGDYAFYCRKGEWPVVPRCGLWGASDD